MDEKPDQIIGQIEAQREELGRNLNELETRVRRSTDWRTYYDRNPMMVLGAALGGGILLGTMVGGKSKSKRRVYSSTSSSSQSPMAAGIMGGALAGSASTSSSSSSAMKKPAGPATSIQKSRVNETIDHMKAALISFGIAKAREFMAQAIPGLDHHFDEAERSKREHHSNLSGSSQGHASGSDFRTHTEANYRSGSGYTSASDYRAPEAVGSNPTPSRP